MEKLELTNDNLIKLGIDPTLNFELIRQKLFEIENLFFDTEKNIIYTNILGAYDDAEYMKALQDSNIPQLHELEEKLETITDENIKNSLFRKGIIRILEANIEAEDTIIEKLLFSKQSGSEALDLDLSDTTAVEKIIYLNELGIIDFLRTKTKTGISNGSLASVIGAITGMNPDTIKSSLNRLPKDRNIDNKHPYHTEKTVARVKTFLTKLGF